MEILDRKDAINRCLYNHQRFIASLALTEHYWFCMALRLKGRAAMG
ncbi:hypothetical protein [Nostoc sp.]